MEIDLINSFSSYTSKPTKAAPLAVFRILFGLIMCISTLRFWYNGWIEKLYLEPQFHFSYSGFEWIKVPGLWTYGLFIICFLSAFFVSIGFKYKVAITSFLLSFTYIELMDKATYLNHYYFVSVISLIMICLPAHCYYSVDAFKHSSIRSEYIPQWSIDILKLMLACVYIYAGLAKLNTDWLFNAMPLAIWLPTKFDLPFLGSLMHEKWMAYLFSWGGALYDLSVVFLLLWKPTRVWAFAMVLIFHVLTRMLFPIGMFPYIMIASTLIFFNASFHENILDQIGKILRLKKDFFRNNQAYVSSKEKFIIPFLSALIIIQLILPLRYLTQSGNVYWTEQGYRFSWRVMLMEKTGNAHFKIVNRETQKRFYVQNHDFLTPFQEKQMSTQPDMILEYGKYLGHHFEEQGHENVEVFVDSHASLNGRPSQKFIGEKVNLMKVNYKELCQHHIIKLNE